MVQHTLKNVWWHGILYKIISKVAERPIFVKSSILLFGDNWSEDAGMSNINEC